MPDRDDPLSPVPESRTVVKKKTRLSVVWIIPIVAALIGAWVAVTSIMNEGPTITIVLKSAEGLKAGKTTVHYNGLDVGVVTSLLLADDHKHVIAIVKMDPKSKAFLVEDSKFWVVSPRISGANVTGLTTILSGAYIGAEIGKSSKRQKHFMALDTPPVVTGGAPGRFYVLKTADLGSVDYGTPVYFRRLNVGKVASYELDQDGRALTVKVFVNAPYDQWVTSATRFWQASGIDVSVSASGVSLRTQSVLSLLFGGLAFETPATDPALPPAEEETVFTLYENRVEAHKPPPRNPQTYVLVFNQSVRGLAMGAPVEFRGIQIGQVEDIRAEFDLNAFEFSIQVTVTVDPERLGVKMTGPGAEARERTAAHREMIDALVSHGLRGQLRTGSLLTGSLYVAVDFFPEAPPVKTDWSQTPVHLATVPGQLEGIEANAASLIKKLEKVPYEEIGEDLRRAIAGFDQTLDNADKLITSNDGLDQELTNSLREVSRAARELRVLADYLERHPEAIIRGKAEQKK